MLSALRAAASGIVAKFLLFILVVSFAVWGASDAFIGGRGATTVQFGDTKVGLNEYRLAYDLQINALSRQLGQRVSREQARAFGVEQSVMGQIVAGAVLDENASNMGLGLSDDRLATLIAEDPTFRDSTGRFSRSALEQVLREVGMRQEDYVRSRKAVAVRRQFLDAVSAASTPPEAFYDAYGAYQSQKRVFEYAEIGESALADKPVAGAADLEAFYEENKGDYVAPEYRQLVIVRLTPEDITRPDLVDDAAVAAEYETRKSTFTTDERRRVQQIVFQDRAAAEAAQQRIAAGEPFETIVAEMGRSTADTDLGLVTKLQIPDVNVADAAFSLNLNETSDVVAGIFGPVLVRVTEISPQSVKPLAEVSDEVRKALALEKATEELFDIHDRIEDERAAGDSLEEAGRKVGLEPRIIDQVDLQGNAPDGSQVADLPERDALLGAAFETDIGVETDPIPIGASGFVWFEVKDITPERQKPLDEVRQQVDTAWIAAETAKKISEVAETVRERVSKGEEFAAVIAEMLPAGQDGTPAAPERSAELTRNDTSSDLTREAVAAGFSIPGDDLTTAPAVNAPNRIVLKVAEVIEGSPAPAPDTIKRQIENSVSDDILNALVSDLQSRGDLRINQQAIDTALSF